MWNISVPKALDKALYDGDDDDDDDDNVGVCL